MKVFRKRVSVVIVSENKILGFHAEDPHNHKMYFFLPGGECELGESPAQTAIRETLEETGYQVKIADVKPILLRYDFEWNGKIYDTETTFITATLANSKPMAVNDASYHRGVDWIPINTIDTIFAYHPIILGVVKQLCYC